GKKMHRAFISPSLLEAAQVGQDFDLDPETAKRFTRILRLKNGTPVELFDGTGRVLTGILEETALKNIQISHIKSKGPVIRLYQALVSMDKLEQITQHSTELGVSEIVLFKSERSQVDFKDKMPAKLERLTRIAQDASRQCGRADVPAVTSPPGPLSSNWREGTRLLLPSPLGGEGLGVRFPKLQETGVIIGPEGGFSPAEIQAFISQGAQEILLAPYVLRTETASLAALAQIQGAFL
ncbi:MAG: RsmE family RNA methyltransferase, partial [Myxococcaceae bacterium]